MNRSIDELSESGLIVLFLTGKVIAKKIDDRWYPFIGGYKMAERFSAPKREGAMLLATQFKENVTNEIIRAVTDHCDIV